MLYCSEVRCSGVNVVKHVNIFARLIQQWFEGSISVRAFWNMQEYYATGHGYGDKLSTLDSYNTRFHVMPTVFFALLQPHYGFATQRLPRLPSQNSVYDLCKCLAI
jgi:hypothetical protein